MIVDNGWTNRAAALRDELVAAGKLTSPEWQAAVSAVPRHEFVPEFYERVSNSGTVSWELLSASSPETRERWWNGVWANTSLVTQLGDLSRWEPGANTGPSSSSSAPSLMTRMLEALDIRDGHRVLEIGTGTGYNAALLNHRLGDHNVFSVDVDAGLVDSARDRLAALGYRPTLATVDGVAGLPEHAPYDRIIATCAVSRVPWCWAEQTRQGGRILVDLKVSASAGNLVLLRREADRLEGRFGSGYATFMHMRTPAFDVEPQAGPERDRADARHATTTLRQERLWEHPPLWFLLHLWQRGRIGFGYAMDQDTGGPGPVFFSTEDGSWCELSTADADGTREVWEGGPRRLWSSIETAMECWHQQGEPGWDRFGLTVTPRHHTIWLDAPDSGHNWPIG
ncbi:MAG: methyltransferase domain-containing protein [Pseudonocardiaceae bacterium]|nr:methyltransferase domain-containing protein [Pseudonocardiaceae bacterium]